jgi:hypothetical protein
MSIDPSVQAALRMARTLTAVSTFARGIGILGVVGSLIGLVAALGARRADDRVGFSLIALGVLMIAVVVWSVGSFHGTFARLAPVVARIDERLDELSRLEQRAPQPGVAVAQPPPESPFEALSAGSLGVSEVADAPPDPPAAEAESPPPAPVVRLPEPKPEPERSPCPSCGGLIHPEATRCVHCMKRVARA